MVTTTASAPREPTDVNTTSWARGSNNVCASHTLTYAISATVAARRGVPVMLAIDQPSVAPIVVDAPRIPIARHARKRLAEKLKQAVGQISEKSDSVQRRTVDHDGLDALLEELAKKPGIHAVHLSKGDELKVTSPDAKWGYSVA